MAALPALDQNVLGEKRMLTVDGDGNAGTTVQRTDGINTINQVNQKLNTQIDQNTTNIRKNTKKINKPESASALVMPPRPPAPWVPLLRCS